MGLLEKSIFVILMYLYPSHNMIHLLVAMSGGINM